MRRIFQYMSDDEKRVARAELVRDIAALEREHQDPTYPRVVRDAIEETLARYRRDVTYLDCELGDEHDHAIE